jgi:VIT1/CCC1 family predicted Fe2+/Mn2+ transporter
MEMRSEVDWSIKTLISISALVLLFHILVVAGALPADIAWGGRVVSEREVLLLEAVSICVNAFLIWTLLQKGRYVRAMFGDRVVRAILWGFFALFLLNSVGNLFAETSFEKSLAFVTLLNVLLIWRINGKA